MEVDRQALKNEFRKFKKTNQYIKSCLSCNKLFSIQSTHHCSNLQFTSKHKDNGNKKNESKRDQNIKTIKLENILRENTENVIHQKGLNEVLQQQIKMQKQSQQIEHVENPIQQKINQHQSNKQNVELQVQNIEQNKEKDLRDKKAEMKKYIDQNRIISQENKILEMEKILFVQIKNRYRGSLTKEQNLMQLALTTLADFQSPYYTDIFDKCQQFNQWKVLMEEAIILKSNRLMMMLGRRFLELNVAQKALQLMIDLQVNPKTWRMKILDKQFFFFENIQTTPFHNAWRKIKRICKLRKR